ncbi:type II toxin-antitoxin system RelE/ParE family toxin [Escherichia coli]|uniref:type II toxin-antitoxin system RelE/ParE family toxin n=1 Tax=Escherichia coli TaxID=562 RepID=UPI0007C3D721|nr:type II toxin-antitoxin system RelE/ParE family toxin [Escherichia coli]EEW5974066.1 type II toxin-antitoxin system RelE/ParE family toxin [Escherichia coli]EEY5898135.1 type II toxin-antitoxin system RelE/ParE family toxin [Escherichia coli]EEZ3920611.1 type II toxin-antitoxin system RelE/ParE family toxin [Escherichia coli]EEZ3997393.1 type II toxin-antitoxin system RelE/ParE family toxin [Escherichia coli]EFA5146958.1 type II toxin-antitoxin system RelE/ParE family toxin [Escherichia col
MTTYILTTDAEADLRGIIRYTRKQWGAAQVRRYIARLEHGIAALAAGRGSFRDMSELFPELRMIHCEHHYVFCLPRGSAPALVVAIFHERMDLMTRLSERLNIESYG